MDRGELESDHSAALEPPFDVWLIVRIHSHKYPLNISHTHPCHCVLFEVHRGQRQDDPTCPAKLLVTFLDEGKERIVPVIFKGPIMPFRRRGLPPPGAQARPPPTPTPPVRLEGS